MDRVRFGRALGYGARHAAKSLLAAADAATTPSTESTPARQVPASPESTTTRTSSQSAVASHSDLPKTAKRFVDGLAQARAVQQQAGKQARRSLFAPLARFSSVVSLQVTGTFFALLAFVMGQATWRARTGMHLGATSSEAFRLYVLAAVFLIFSYFAISNFVRARRRERR